MPKRFGTPGPRLMLPTICTSVPVSGCSVEAQLLFDRLIVQADDQGRLQGEARVVAALCMPLIRTATEVKVARWLGELATAGLVTRYTSEGRELIQLAGWWDNQGTPRRSYPSRYPGPDGWQDRIRMDGEPPQSDGDSGRSAEEPPQSADIPPRIGANRGGTPLAGARDRASVPSPPVSPHSVASSSAPSPRDGDDDGLTTPRTKKERLDDLSVRFQAGEFDELEYKRRRDEVNAA